MGFIKVFSGSLSGTFTSLIKDSIDKKEGK